MGCLATTYVFSDAMVMLTPLIAGVPLASLGERVGTLEEEGVTILAALDLHPASCIGCPI